MAPLRWGIAGCGNISHDFVTALKHEGSESHLVAAVAARDLERARQFGVSCRAARTYSSYEALARDADVDVVYIGTVNSTHFEIAKIMLAVGKPVLCEKPMCMGVCETAELVSLARANGTFLMEGIWSRHFPAYKKLQDFLASGDLGDIKHLVVSFGFPLWEVPNVREKVLGGGAMFAIGLYALQLAMVVFGGQEEPAVAVLGAATKEVEREVVFSLQYPGGGLASVTVSTSCVLPNQAVVVGTRGSVTIPEFWAPTRLHLPDEDFKAPLDASELPYNLPGSQGLKYQANEVARCLRLGLTESPAMTLSESLALSRMVEAVRRGAGVMW